MGQLATRLSTTFDAANTQSQLSLRQRAGDLTLAEGANFSAGAIGITADQGALNLAGKLITPAGDVGLWAKGSISLAASSAIRAQSLSLASQSGSILAQAGSQITRANSSKPGELTLTASEKGLLASSLKANTEGWNLNAEIWLRQAAPEAGVSLALLEAMNTKAEAFLAANPELFAALTPGQTTAGGVSLHAEVYSTGSIALAEKLDLSNWRLGKTQGPVTPEEPVPGEEPGS
jgi:hypothetical protein